MARRVPDSPTPSDDSPEPEHEPEQEAEHASPRGAKRARANESGDAHVRAGGKGKGRARQEEEEEKEEEEEQQQGEGEEEQEEQEEVPEFNFEPVEHARHPDGYIPGSIVRVALHNFVTYDHVEFRPGPHLNMVIGPNGTGKSTIVCGIALGLGWTPKVLGRASEIMSFVKQGHEKGWIEIELKGHIGERNSVIRRSINADNKGSEYSLNGKSATQDKIKQTVSSYGVQVGNLCSFLPQDKVVEFAQMSPQQLLRETQRAAEGVGAGDLTAWHEELIRLGEQKKELGKALAGDEDERKTKADANNLLYKEVERYKEREALERQIKVLELMIPFARYSVAKATYDQAKVERKRLNDIVKEIERGNRPLEEARSVLTDRQSKAEGRRKAADDAFTKLGADITKKSRALGKIEEEMETVYNKMDSIKTDEKRRKEKIKKLHTDLEKAQKFIDNGAPSDEGLDEINRELNASSEERRRVGQKVHALQDQYRDIEEEGNRLHATIDRARERIARLEDGKNRRLQKLAGADKDTAKAIHLLRENKHRFKQEVFEPAYVSCSVVHPRYAAGIESLVNFNQMKTFVCQNQEDYDMFTAQLIDKGKLRLNVVHAVFNPDVMRQPCSRDEIQAIGFDGFAIDVMEGPEQVLHFLKGAAYLHRIPIATDSRSVNFDALENHEAYRRQEIRRYVAGTESYVVAWSRYGARTASTSTKSIKPAQTFVDPGVDEDAKRALEREIEEADAQLKTNEAKVQELTAQDKKFRDEADELKATKDSLIRAKEEIMAERRKYEKAIVQLNTLKANLKREEAAPSAESERQGLMKKIRKGTKNKYTLVLEQSALVQDAVRNIELQEEFGLNIVQANANLAALDSVGNETNERLKQASAELHDANAVYERAKAESAQQLHLAKSLLNDVDEDLRAAFVRARGDEEDEKSVEQLEDELAEARANLDLNTASNGAVMQTYERRKAEIERLEQAIHSKTTKLRKITKRIGVIRNQWEPTLQGLIHRVSERFSAAFDRIGCAGDVSLRKDEENYENWAIEIRVKFRDNEQLQLLTAQRQSGGERSLSTILYLMSLTELSKSPFSLVDEINQGMDQRAERLVHNQMVEVTCNRNAGQYFLITPKLLPGLTYHRKMKILCINNGEWLDVETGNLKSLLNNFLKKSQGGGDQGDRKPVINANGTAVAAH